MSDVEDKQKRFLIEGALYSLKTQRDKSESLKKIAMWMLLEDLVGDKDFSFRIALTIPTACAYSASESKILELFDEQGARRLLHKTRTSFFILRSRSIQLGRGVI